MGRFRDAWDAFRGNSLPRGLEGELAFADPFRLYPGNQITPYNPSNMIGAKGYQIIDRMRRDEQVKAAMLFKKHAVMSAGWEIAPAEGGEEIAEFVNEQFERLEGTLEQGVLQIMTALDYGFSVTEKVFEDQGSQIGLKALKTKRPKWFGFRQDEFGNITDITQQQDRGEVVLPRNKFVIFTYQPEFGNPYGISDLEAAYRAWWSKDNAYKWLNMLLERFGVPPIFALYNTQVYQGNTLGDLKTIIKNLQAATAGIIPRGENGEKDLELWAPEIAGQVSAAFDPAINRFDQDIAKAILMPGLLGVSPEASTGSLARAKVVFDVFMFVVDYLRKEIAETVMNEQIVRPLVDLNFAVTEYPEFRLLPIDDDTHLELFKTWAELVQADIVVSTLEDERHIRAALEFPERNEDEPALIDEPEPEPESESEEKTEFAQSRKANGYEKRTDFTQIAEDLDTSEAAFIEEAKTILTEAKNTVIKRVANQGVNRTTARKAKGLPNPGKLRARVLSFLTENFDGGRARLAEEVPGAREMREQDENGPNFIPEEAIRHLRDKSVNIAGVVDEELTRGVKRALMQSLEQGETTRQATERIATVFEPFIGDPTKLRDGQPLAPHRLEAIARTESTAAFNQGRLVESRRPGVAPLIRGMEYSAIMDSRTTEVCAHLDGKVFKSGDAALDRLRPPNHVNCRSILVPVTVAEEVDEEDFVTPSQAARGEELAGKGFV